MLGSLGFRYVYHTYILVSHNVALSNDEVEISIGNSFSVNGWPQSLGLLCFFKEKIINNLTNILQTALSEWILPWVEVYD